jgi:hypothetical protein
MSGPDRSAAPAREKESTARSDFSNLPTSEKRGKKRAPPPHLSGGKLRRGSQVLEFKWFMEMQLEGKS